MQKIVTITDEKTIKDILDSASYGTMALCFDNRPLKILIEIWPTFLIKNDPPADWNYNIKFRYFYSLNFVSFYFLAINLSFYNLDHLLKMDVNDVKVYLVLLLLSHHH